MDAKVEPGKPGGGPGGLRKTRMMVCARGIEIWVRILSEHADRGDKEAERALDKLRDAFETAAPLCGEGVPLKGEDKFYAIYEALKILERAAQGQPEYPADVLRRIAEQTAEDCRELGLDRLDIGFFTQPEK